MKIFELKGKNVSLSKETNLARLHFDVVLEKKKHIWKVSRPYCLSQVHRQTRPVKWREIISYEIYLNKFLLLMGICQQWKNRIVILLLKEIKKSWKLRPLNQTHQFMQHHIAISIILAIKWNRSVLDTPISSLWIWINKHYVSETLNFLYFLSLSLFRQILHDFPFRWWLISNPILTSFTLTIYFWNSCQ